MSGSRIYALSGAALTAALIALIVALSMNAADGRLIYSLDDAYIHLSIAETILRGGYGVNLSEYASPSSSILWPWLLSGLLAIGLGHWSPLILSGAVSVLVSGLLASTVWRHTVEPSDARSVRRAWILLPVLIFAVNGVALPMTGMEHPLHVLATMLVLVGLFDLSRDSRVAPSLVVGIILAPLTRFEGLALSAAALAALLWNGRILTAVLTGGVLAACLAAYVGYMSSLGLPPLPSSVMTKSGASTAVSEGRLFGLAASIIENVAEALKSGTAVILVACGYLILRHLLSSRNRGKATAIVGAVALWTITAHLAGGMFGGLPRYEIYVVAAAIVALAILYGDMLRAGEEPRSTSLLLVGLLLAFAIVFGRATVITPPASRNIYEQQYQMHRLATEFLPEPVAVNDLGFVSYQNDNYVLDLWGLGSEEARLHVRRGPDPQAAIARLTAETGVRWAMIYDDWFGTAVPPEWCRAGTLTTSAVTASQPVVSIYLIDPELGPRLEAALTEISPTLPDGAVLERTPCA